MANSHRSMMMTLCLSVAAVATSVCQTAAETITTVYAVCVKVVDWVLERVVTAVKRLAQPLHVPRVAAALVQARAFVQRLAKRETPRVTPGWRMCPSI